MSSVSGAGAPQRLGKILILPISIHVGLLIIFDLGDHLAPALLLVGVGFLGVFLAERHLRGCSWRSVWWPILVVAAILRALLLPLPPSLSEDVERYVWDGRVASSGFNPYKMPPDAPELAPLRDALWEGLPHRQVPTVYPPLAETLFAIAALLPASVFNLKLILVLFDLGTCGLLLLLARSWSLPPERTLWYAWNPLVTVEIAGMGHIEGLGVVLVVLVTALLAIDSGKVGRASIAAAGAVLTKLVPILALPVWGRQSGHPRRFIFLAFVFSAMGLLPVVISTGGAPPGLVEYGVSWEFNGPIFEPLWRLLERLDLQPAVEAGLDWLKGLTGEHDVWNHLYPFNYPQLWAKVVLSLGLLSALIWSWRTKDTAQSLGRVFGSMLIFSATVYPWYVLWVLPWAALLRHPAWLGLSGLLFFSYVPQFWDVPLFPWIQALIWLPFVGILLVERRWSTR